MERHIERLSICRAEVRGNRPTIHLWTPRGRGRALSREEERPFVHLWSRGGDRASIHSQSGGRQTVYSLVEQRESCSLTEKRDRPSIHSRSRLFNTLSKHLKFHTSKQQTVLNDKSQHCTIVHVSSYIYIYKVKLTGNNVHHIVLCYYVN